jgi:hypothetical protein
MKGVLKKQGAGWTFGAPFWRDRYFKEESDRISYFKQASDPSPQGHIDFSSILEVQVWLTL